jgi:hypothetical protein
MNKGVKRLALLLGGLGAVWAVFVMIGLILSRDLEVGDGVGYAMFYSRSHHAVIRVFGDAGNVIETRQQGGEFKEW